MTLTLRSWNRILLLAFVATVWDTSITPRIYWLCLLLPLMVALQCKVYRKTALIFVAFMSITLLHAEIMFNKTNMLYSTGEHITITVKIDSYFRENNYASSVLATVLNINGQSFPFYIQPKIQLFSDHALFQIDEVWQVSGELKPIIGTDNRTGFDKERMAMVKQLSAGFYVDHQQPMKLHAYASFRATIRQHLAYYQTQFSSFPLILALTTGEKQWIEHKQWQRFQQAGLAHLFAISGLHIGLAFGVGYILGWGIAGALSALSFRCLLWLPSIIGLGSAFMLAYLSAMSLPTQRALLALVLVLLCRHGRYPISSKSLFFIVAVIILLIWPTSIFGVSFWLSFVAVAIIVWSKPYWNVGGTWSKAVRLQLALSLLMIPVMSWIFQGFPALSLLWNLVVGLLFSLLLMPLILFTTGLVCIEALLTPYVFHGFTYWMYEKIAYLFDILNWGLNHFPVLWLELEFRLLGTWGLLVISVMTRVSRFIKVIALLLCLHSSSSEQSQMKITVFDVGHGLAVLVETPDMRLLYDTGAHWQAGSIAERILVPNVHTQPQLDLFVLSHDDNDHAGGEELVRQHWRPKQVISPRTSSETACIAGNTWQFGQTRVEALWPLVTVSRVYNPQSCILHIRHQQRSLLLTGDINAVAEYMLSRQTINLHSEVMLVPHHGSRSSSTNAFIQAVNPKIAVSSNQYKGRWNLPNPEVVNRYLQQGAIWIDTGECGAIELFGDQYGWYWQSQRSFQSWFRRIIRRQSIESNVSCYRQNLD